MEVHVVVPGVGVLLNLIHVRLRIGSHWIAPRPRPPLTFGRLLEVLREVLLGEITLEPDVRPPLVSVRRASSSSSAQQTVSCLYRGFAARLFELLDQVGIGRNADEASPAGQLGCVRCGGGNGDPMAVCPEGSRCGHLRPCSACRETSSSRLSRARA